MAIVTIGPISLSLPQTRRGARPLQSAGAGRLAALLVISVLSFALPIGAQAITPPLHLRDTVRVRVMGSGEVEGVVIRTDSSRLVISTKGEPPLVSIPFSDVLLLERLARTRTLGKRAVIAGMVIGLASGVLLGNRVRNQDVHSGGLLIPDFPYKVVGGALGAGVGAIVGGLVGKIEFHSWEQVNLTRSQE